MRVKEKYVAERALAILIAFCMIFYGSGYHVQAGKELGGSATVEVSNLKYIFDVRYVDNEDNELETGYTTEQIKFESTDSKEYSLNVKEIEGYKYAGYYYEIKVSGKKVDLTTGSTIKIENIEDTDVAPVGVVTYTVHMMYTKESGSKGIDGNTTVTVNKIAYTINVKHIDTDVNEIYDSYSDMIEGTKSKYSLKIADIAGYEYEGYYYENETGTQGINAQGSLSSLLTDADPIVTPDSEGRDAVSGKGVYNVYAVYSQTGDVSLIYSVTYDANGGVGSVIDSKAYVANDKVTVLGGDGLTKSGYTFSGWNTSADGGGTGYAAGDTFTITENTTLYAQWDNYTATDVPLTYSVIYDANGGEGSVIDPKAYATNDKVTVLGGNGFSREGYTFNGWNAAADGSGTGYAARDIFTITENITLYAQWIESPGSGAATPKSSSVKTDDNPLVGFYLLVMFLAAVFVSLVLYWRKKHKKV